MSEVWDEPHLQSDRLNRATLAETATGKIQKFVLRAPAKEIF